MPQILPRKAHGEDHDAEGNAMSASPITFNDGKAYELLMGRWSRLAGDQFLDWIEPPKGLRWIDVGCGNGAFTEVLIARTSPAAVTGIDPSEGQISYARSRPGTAMAEFQTGSALSLPFPDNSFDAASMALVIAFVDDPGKAAAEMARVVRPGGLVATYMWSFPEGFPLRWLGPAMKSLGLNPVTPPNTAAANLENLSRYWQQAGLQSIETRVIRVQIAYADFDDFWQSATAPVGPSGKATAELSPEMREQLKKRLREQLPTDANGRIVYDAVANAVKGRVPA
jgi:ubiquinone/menaquinone biosynthesis C-methylase UbiE